MSPWRKAVEKAWRSVGSPTSDTAVWGHSPDITSVASVIHDDREWSIGPQFRPRLLNEPPVILAGPWKLRPQAARTRFDGFLHGCLFTPVGNTAKAVATDPGYLRVPLCAPTELPFGLRQCFWREVSRVTGLINLHAKGCIEFTNKFR